MRVTPRLTRAACGHEYRSKLVVSNAVRWDKAKNPIFWVGANLGVRRHVPDYCLTNGICGLDYRLLVVLDTTRLRLAPNIDPASYRSQCGDHQRKSNTALHRGPQMLICRTSPRVGMSALCQKRTRQWWRRFKMG